MKTKNPRRTQRPTAPQGKRTDVGGAPPVPINAAVDAIEQVLGLVYPADSVLSHFFRDNKTGARDRAFIAEQAYAVLRRKRSLERVARLHPAPMALARQLTLLALLRVQGWSLRQLEPLVGKRDHGWLESVAQAREQDAVGETPAERLDLPDWLYERFCAQWPEPGLTSLVQALASPAPLDLRVNTLKGERDKVLTQLRAEGMGAEPCAYSPVGLRLAGKPALHKHPLFLDGVVEVQDEGSQLLPLLVAPKRGEMVADFCAGAGGKTLQLGAMMRSTGRLYAFDVSDKRLAKLKPRAARAGLSNVHPIVIDSENDQRVRRLAGKLDRVLVDAPCSGLGTLRRNPDLKWRQSPQALAELTQKQRAILAAAARLIKPGGRLVYATCSLLAEENEAVVGDFLAAHPEFALRPAAEVLAQQQVSLPLADAYLRLDPRQHACDGFFAAVLERQAS